MGQVTLDGVLVRTRVQEQFYFAVNKPTGFICTSNRDSPEVKNKKIVLDLFEGWMCKWKEEKPKVSGTDTLICSSPLLCEV